jgi:multimeric flavodoxin WrbA
MKKKILGIVGSYRKGGTIDTLVSEILSSAEESGAEVEKVFLSEKNIQYCTNCRQCTQEPGEEHGKCVLDDDMGEIISRYLECDAVVIGSPTNFFNVTAVTKTFMERTLCFSYWPWGKMIPKFRLWSRKKRAVLVCSSSMPGVVGRVVTSTMRSLRLLAKGLGASVYKTIYIGGVAGKEKPELSPGLIQKARKVGKKLALK